MSTYTPKKPSEEVLEYIRDNFQYDPCTGIIYRYKIMSQQFEAVTTTHKNGYVEVKIKGRKTKGHHVAWFLHYNEWPTHEIDHKDRDNSNNKILNLRSSDRLTQAQNKNYYKNVSQYGRGVHAKYGKYYSVIQINGKQKHLGYFRNKEDAIKARREAELKYYGVQ